MPKFQIYIPSLKSMLSYNTLEVVTRDFDAEDNDSHKKNKKPPAVPRGRSGW